MAYGTPIKDAILGLRRIADTHRFGIDKGSDYSIQVSVPYCAHGGFYMKHTYVFLPYWGQEPEQLKAMLAEKVSVLQ